MTERVKGATCQTAGGNINGKRRWSLGAVQIYGIRSGSASRRHARPMQLGYVGVPSLAVVEPASCMQTKKMLRNIVRQKMLRNIVIIYLSFLNLVLWAQDQEQVQPGPPDYCLKGPFHKDAPSPEAEGFHECLSWQDHACCNLALTMSISRHKARELYNYSWDRVVPCHHAVRSSSR